MGLLEQNSNQSKCECGKRKRKESVCCRDCNAKYMAKRAAKCTVISEKGICPNCGTELYQNICLPGQFWFQCKQYGALIDGYDETKPKCGFQIIWDH